MIGQPKPRICMPTARTFTKKVFQCGLYEAQDVLTQIDDVDLIHLEPGNGFRIKEGWQRRLLYHDVSRRLVFRNPGLKKVRLTHDYDLFVVSCQTYWDFLYLSAIEGWKDHCKTSVVWIDELWAAAIPLYKYWLHALRQFDHIFVGYSGTAVPLSNAIGQTCHWLPGGVDAMRFNPFPEPPSRAIDVYSIGRRWEGVHQTLLHAAGRGDLFYIYDTIPSAERETYDPRQHRELYANLAKRSRCFMVAPGKMDASSETKGQVEIGYRYYEGAAAGAVMVGQAPECDSFTQMFPWEDAVLHIQPDGSDVLKTLETLASEPERASALSRRNSAGALLSHDWAYRWKRIFQVAGIQPAPGMEERARRLNELAIMACQTA
jgi:hypothetical protein